MKTTFILSAFFLLLATLALRADIDDMTFKEGATERDGICYNYKILTYYTTSGRKMKIFEQECEGDCWEIVYDGPFSIYAGPYDDEAEGGLPLIVVGGYGHFPVTSGQGGLFAPSGPACDAEFIPNPSSSILVISPAFLVGAILN